MDDRFMAGLKRTPDPEFERRLRDRLRLAEEAQEEDGRRPRRWGLVLAPTMAVALLASVILFPSVRASAQAFLDLFRVRNFTAVSVSPDRIQELKEAKLELKTMIGEHVETILEPGPFQNVDSPAQAGAAAGIVVKVPTVLPAGLKPDTVSWRGPGEARVTADVTRLRHVLETLAIKDVTVPQALDGQRIDIRMPPVVVQRFKSERREARLLQSRSPEVGLPSGVDLANLGEIGLRILGLSSTEARRLSQSTDWRSTMLIPVPGNAGSFRQVQVNGQPGLLVTHETTTAEGRKREGGIVLWSEGDMVYALGGDVFSADLLQMANSLQ